MRLADRRPTVLRLSLTVIATLACCGLVWWCVFVVPRNAGHKAASIERSARFFLGTTLREAQLTFAVGLALDKDGDGEGEFGTLTDLILGPEPCNSPSREILKDVKRFRPASCEAQISDFYLSKVFLPEQAQAAEISWCAVAWPLNYGQGGVERSFLFCWSFDNRAMNFSGECDVRRFSGWGGGPNLSDIFVGEPFRSEIRRDLWESH